MLARFVDGPDGVRAGLAPESFGHDVEIDSHDAMRALNRFPAGAYDRVNEYAKVAPAKEQLPAALDALRPLTEQDAVTAADIQQALASVGIDDHFTSRPAGRGVMFGAGVSPGGCIFGLVAPGALDVQADGHLAEGGCPKPPGR